MLQSAACGFGFLAFAGLAQGANSKVLLPSDDPFAPKSPHFTPKAKRVIFLCMAGGPSHVDTFDYKPELATMDGKNYRRNAKLMASPWKFKQRGKSGLWISDLFPNVGGLADELTLLRSMKAAIPAHAQATKHLHTGSFQFVRPSLGAWSFYGLGTMNENLPGFVTINPRNGGAENYGSSFLPATYQGTPVNLGSSRQGGQSEDPIQHITNDRTGSRAQQEQLDLLRTLERERGRRGPAPSTLRVRGCFLRPDLRRVHRPGYDGPASSTRVPDGRRAARPTLAVAGTSTTTRSPARSRPRSASSRR